MIRERVKLPPMLARFFLTLIRKHGSGMAVLVNPVVRMRDGRRVACAPGTARARLYCAGGFTSRTAAPWASLRMRIESFSTLLSSSGLSIW